MNLEQFRKTVLKTTWYVKYFSYALFSALIIGGFFILYDVIVHYTKYDKSGTRYLGYLFFILSVSIGIWGLIVTTGRNKIILIASQITPNKKATIINSVIKKFGNPVWDNEKSICCCYYRKKWWQPDYKISLSFDLSTFFVSVEIVTRNFGAGIDLGEMPRIRQKVISDLTDLIS
jgi:hypothetical protein